MGDDGDHHQAGKVRFFAGCFFPANGQAKSEQREGNSAENPHNHIGSAAGIQKIKRDMVNHHKKGGNQFQHIIGDEAFFTLHGNAALSRAVYLAISLFFKKKHVKDDSTFCTSLRRKQERQKTNGFARLERKLPKFLRFQKKVFFIKKNGKIQTKCPLNIWLFLLFCAIFYSSGMRNPFPYKQACKGE